ncbi:PD-(D/E)XK nuclease family protein [Polyangium aurulentum]|uniref:PD-(D/E)XK nuclease family protein n=1 Tax=Polyangium aurulentum TaxID=2567896 RepID=UPI00113D1BA0|nr:PD-(D/E)XK nuclease family protein [Polyangium aurulentum]UQA59442.1 PD-(D/E)XK nuclease family protein [Polyangium aurulentum]
MEIALTTPGAAARGARTLRSFVQDALVTLAPEVGWASTEGTRLVARAALEAAPIAGVRLPDEPAERVGFAHVVDTAIGRLRRAGTRPEHLFGAPGAEAALLAEVMRRADELLAARGLVDPRAGGFALARAIRSRPCDAIFDEMNAREVLLSGMLNFEPDDLVWLEALNDRARKAGGRGVSVTLPLFTGTSLFAEPSDDEEAVGTVAAALEKRWGELENGPEIDWQHLGEVTAQRIVRAANPEGEARAVAGEVLAALGSGIPPEAIAILVPQLDDTALDPLRAALEDARIPFHEPRGPSPDTSPEGRAALGLLSLAAGPVTRERVIELLRAPGVHAGIWVGERSERDAEAKAALLAHRLRDVPVEVDRSGKLLVEVLRGAIEAEGRGDEAWMPAAIERMLASVQRVAAGQTRAEIATRFDALCDRLQLGTPSMNELGAALRIEAQRGRSLALRAIGEGSAAVRALRDAARGIVEAALAVGMESTPTKVEEMLAEIRRAASGSRIDGGGGRAGAVRIARPTELCGMRHELLIVTGLSPAAYGPEGEGALIDERLWAALPPGARPKTARERDRVRRMELAWAMGSARRVILSHAAGEDEGAQHPIIARAVKAGVSLRQEPSSRVSRAASRIDPRGAELVALSAGSLPAPLIADRVSIERARLAFFLDPRGEAGPFTGRIDCEDPALSAHLRACVGGDTPERPISVTNLEKAAGCAFAGFARRVWRTRRSEDALEAADPRERGNQVHAAVAAAFAAARDAGGKANRQKALVAARDAAIKALGADKEAAPLRREILTTAVADALALVAHGLAEEGFSFGLAEQPFGPDELPPWDVLPLPPEPGIDGQTVFVHGDTLTVFVEGKIDRIDRADGDKRSARVVDYKTGTLPKEGEQGSLHLQLPLYAAAVARALGVEEVQALYISADKRGAISASPTDRSLEKTEARRRAIADRRGDATRVARRAVLGLWSGRIDPRPQKSDICEWCDARDVCRRPAVVPEEIEGDAEEGAAP